MLGNCGYGHMMGYGYGGTLMWLLFLVVIIAMLYALTQNSKSKGSGSESGEKPLDILKKRYAKGEISKEEFEKIKKDIE